MRSLEMKIFVHLLHFQAIFAWFPLNHASKTIELGVYFNNASNTIGFGVSLNRASNAVGFGVFFNHASKTI